MNFPPVALKDRNPVASAWLKSAANATGAEILEDFNAETTSGAGVTNSVGWLSVAYDPYSGFRHSSSVAYLHPIIGVRQNLRILTETWVHNLVWDEHDTKHVVGVRATTKHGQELVIRARKEVVLSAGAIDSPRLLLLSGVGPAAELEALGIKSTHDLPGVGDNLVSNQVFMKEYCYSTSASNRLTTSRPLSCGIQLQHPTKLSCLVTRRYSTASTNPIPDLI